MNSSLMMIRAKTILFQPNIDTLIHVKQGLKIAQSFYKHDS